MIMKSKCNNCNKAIGTNSYEVKRLPNVTGVVATASGYLKHFCSVECLRANYCKEGEVEND